MCARRRRAPRDKGRTDRPTPTTTTGEKKGGRTATCTCTHGIAHPPIKARRRRDRDCEGERPERRKKKKKKESATERGPRAPETDRTKEKRKRRSARSPRRAQKAPKDGPPPGEKTKEGTRQEEEKGHRKHACERKKKATQHTFGRQFANQEKKRESRIKCHAAAAASFGRVGVPVSSLSSCADGRKGKKKKGNQKKRQDRQRFRKTAGKDLEGRGGGSGERRRRRRGVDRTWGWQQRRRRQQVTSGLKRDPTESALGPTTRFLGAPAHRPTGAHRGMGSSCPLFSALAHPRRRSPKKERRERERERETACASDRPSLLGRAG